MPEIILVVSWPCWVPGFLLSMIGRGKRSMNPIRQFFEKILSLALSIGIAIVLPTRFGWGRWYVFVVVLYALPTAIALLVVLAIRRGGGIVSR